MAPSRASAGPSLESCGRIIFRRFGFGAHPGQNDALCHHLAFVWGAVEQGYENVGMDERKLLNTLEGFGWLLAPRCNLRW